jgi:hypothetical protein
MACLFKSSVTRQSIKLDLSKLLYMFYILDFTLCYFQTGFARCAGSMAREASSYVWAAGSQQQYSWGPKCALPLH